MFSPLLPFQTLEVALVSLLILSMLGFWLSLLRRFKQMQYIIARLDTTQRSTQETVHQHHTSTQEQIQEVRLTQAATKATVEATHQETQRFVHDLQTLQHASHTLMHEIKTPHSHSQTLMTDWQKETTQLSRALRTTYQQGIWGEQELERVVEFAGMQRYCDFDVQLPLPNGQKPDLLIHLHNHRTIAVDAKAPSQAYLDAMNCEDEAVRATKLKMYARNVREIMNDLAKKAYWKQLQPGLELVILFIPNEAMFRAALQYDFGLLDLANEKHVLLASPVTLIALLKAIAYGWSQEERAQHVQQIVDHSKELHKELEGWLRQWQTLKKAIQTTSTEFNRVANRYETQILPLIHALGALDSTLQIKEKAFELKPLQPLTNTSEEESERPKPLEEEQ
jgi:DNA recombination protein RmuC